MRNSIVITNILLLFILFGYSCTKETTQNEILYFNSFESPADTANWKGYCYVELLDSTPTNDAGNKSIAISCGCLGPHTYFTIPSPSSDTKVVLSCWGKGKDIGGNISLNNETKSININIPGDISYWTEFQSPDTLFCLAGEKLTIGLSAGGLADGTINIDLLKVEKVE